MPKHPGGRPTKYRPEYAEQAAKLSRLGATDADLADYFEVNILTIRNWCQRHEEFFRSVKMVKDAINERVEKSLAHKAIGYTYDTEKIYMYEGEPVRVPYREHVPPDTTAGIFWLKNRKPEEWNDRVNVNGQIQHDHRHLHAHLENLDLSRYTDEQLAVVEEVIRALLNGTAGEGSAGSVLAEALATGESPEGQS